MKNKFAVDTSSFSTIQPTLPKGFYAGHIINATVVGKDGKRYIKIKEETIRDSVTKENIPTGNYIITGLLMFGAVLTSKNAARILGRDEPRVFGGMINLNFSDKFILADNFVLGSWLEALGLKDVDFAEMVDCEEDENIEVPEELKRVPNIVDMLNSVEYYTQYFTTMCNMANNTAVKVNVIQQPTRNNPHIMENVIDRGNFSTPTCGILPYTEGCENDIDD